MKYELRDYQKKASDAAVDFFLDDNRKGNGIIVAATGAGKSIIIADIAYRLDTDVLVFCPTKEILQQNYRKMCSYGVECSMYSASVNQKSISRVTFCTIGSVKNYADLFKHFKYVMVDEAHLVSSKQGMYKTFLKALRRKVIGFTATPYRLETDVDMNYKTKKFNGANSYLKMLTSYRGAIFKDIIFTIEAKELIDRGYLAKLDYFDVKPPMWDESKMFKNSSGSDYSDSSVQWMMDKTRFDDYLESMVRRLMNPKSGQKRNGILVFTRFVKTAMMLASRIEGCSYISGDMSKKNRERILEDFENGRIEVLCNANCLVVGYDRPDLDTVLLATPTLSLARYYQEVGRAIRPSDKKKDSWIVDLCGNISRFGHVDDIRLFKEEDKWHIGIGGESFDEKYL